MHEISHHHLYEISISELGLSDKAYKELMGVGMSSVGDCIDNYIARSLNDLIPVRSTVYFNTEVKQKVKDAGCWHFVEEHISNNEE